MIVARSWREGKQATQRGSSESVAESPLELRPKGQAAVTSPLNRQEPRTAQGATWSGQWRWAACSWRATATPSSAEINSSPGRTWAVGVRVGAGGKVETRFGGSGPGVCNLIFQPVLCPHFSPLFLSPFSSASLLAPLLSSHLLLLSSHRSPL